jgi:rod shape-determining protein MreC
VLVERARMAVYDASGPIYAVLAEPLATCAGPIGRLGPLGTAGENARLREENERLRRWQSVALALDAENQR